MSVEIWPHVAPDQLKAAIETAEKREIDWLIEELRETLVNLKHGLEDCYALLAPIDPGSTLVLSTPRNEVVKGHITRVGTRVVKGTIHLRLRTLPHQTLTINPDHPIHIASLTSLHALLTHSIDLLSLTLSYSYPSSSPSPSNLDIAPPQFLSAQLRLLSQSLAEATSLLKGPPLTTADPTWTTHSVSPTHFLLPPGSAPGAAHTFSPSSQQHPPPLSFHLSIQDSSMVLWLRSLEPADAPVNFGTKLALAIGTARRLEHDETEKIFGYCCAGDEHALQHHPTITPTGTAAAGSVGGGGGTSPIPLSGTRTSTASAAAARNKSVDVFVREKVRVESADPSLLSLSSKLTALGHTLALARRNLAAVMGEEVEPED